MAKTIDTLVISFGRPRRNLIAKDLRSPKYRMRVAVSKKHYNRNAEKNALRRELFYA